MSNAILVRQWWHAKQRKILKCLFIRILTNLTGLNILNTCSKKKTCLGPLKQASTCKCDGQMTDKSSLHLLPIHVTQNKNSVLFTEIRHTCLYSKICKCLKFRHKCTVFIKNAAMPKHYVMTMHCKIMVWGKRQGPSRTSPAIYTDTVCHLFMKISLP